MIGSLGGASRGISFGHRFPRLPQRRVSKPPSKSAVNLPLALDLRRPPCTGRQQPRRSRSVPNLEGARSQPPGRRARRPPARSEQARRSPETGCALTGLLAVPCGKKLARPTPRVSRGRPHAELHRQCRQSEANNMSCDEQKTRMLCLCLRPANAGIVP